MGKVKTSSDKSLVKLTAKVDKRPKASKQEKVVKSRGSKAAKIQTSNFRTTTAGDMGIHRYLAKSATMTFGLRLQDRVHVNFMNPKQSMSTQELAEILFRGTKHIPARDAFKQFGKDRKKDIKQFAGQCIKGEISQSELEAELKNLFVDWVVTGNVRPANETSYASRKNSLGKGTTPLLATGEFIDSVEVYFR